MIHDLLADVDPRGLEHFARLDEIAVLLGLLQLDPGDRDLFERSVEAARAAVGALDAPLQPVHGDAHAGNGLRSPTGPDWTDFENVCLGPASSTSRAPRSARDGFGP